MKRGIAIFPFTGYMVQNVDVIHFFFVFRLLSINAPFKYIHYFVKEFQNFGFFMTIISVTAVIVFNSYWLSVLLKCTVFSALSA